MLFVGSIDFGYLLWKDMSINEAIRSGAVLATAMAEDCDEFNEESTNDTAIKDYIINITDGTNLQSSEITISATDTTGVEVLTISVTHVHDYLAPVSFNRFKAGSGAQTFTINKSFSCGFVTNNENWYDFAADSASAP
jgi:hypothetical protein